MRLDIGGSVGVSTYPHDGRDVETLLQRADIAMYEAKSGRTGVQRYAREQDADNLIRLTLAGDLRRALDVGEIVTEFQPKIDLRADRVCGAEALVRWRHPQRGEIAPELFIGIAEQTGFIVPITLHVLARRRARRPRVAPPRQPPDGRGQPLGPRAARARPARARSASSAARTTSRPTRSCSRSPRAWSSPTRSACCPTLNRLAAAGVVLSVDDFGTGYSSLEYLKKLPVRELKIDRGFVMGMRTDPRDTAIVRSAIHLAHSLGLRVVAEGVDSAHTHDELATLDCDQAQGFRYSPSLPGAAAALLGGGLRRAADADPARDAAPAPRRGLSRAARRHALTRPASAARLPGRQRRPVCCRHVDDPHRLRSRTRPRPRRHARSRRGARRWPPGARRPATSRGS